jgi:Kef-type K+ transport system membrane component KefB
MNSRGLTELIVIQSGITLGILSERLASMMIIMAVLTTVVATPAFRWIYTATLQEADRDIREARQPAPDVSLEVLRRRGLAGGHELV